MRNYLFLLLLTLFAACTSKGPKDAIIAGSLPNFTESYILLNTKGLSDTIKLNDDKTFTYKVMLDKTSLFTLRAYRTQAQVYLNPSDSMFVSLDFANVQDGPIFTGANEMVNKYLFGRNKAIRGLIGNWQDLYGKDKEQFNLKLDTIKTSLFGMLDSIKTAGEEILNLEKVRIDYLILGLKSNFPEYNAEINGIPFNSDSADYSYFDGFDPNNGYHMMFDDYTNLVNKFVMNKLTKEVKMDEYQAKPAIEKFNQMFSIIDTNITNSEIRDYLKHNELIDELQFGKFYELSDIVNKFLAGCQTEGYKNKISAIYNNKMKLAPGQVAPVFKYKDVTGKDFSLEDFKGKLVYIDFWATWCGPCKYELPYLEKLQEQYKGKKIVFISLSVDDDVTAWETMVKEKKMKGVQLYADGAWVSDAAVNYQVKGIPTFYMVDGNSMILMPNAPRPSSEEIRPLIDENLKKL